MEQTIEIKRKVSLEDILDDLKSKALKTEDAKERKELMDTIIKLEALNNAKKKNEAEAFLKILQIFGIPILTVGCLFVYRLLMETETPPDILFRDMGKTIINFATKKTV